MKSTLHFSPGSGWMNDPNGLIYRGGRHHLFFQHEPSATSPHRLRWGHASSADLITWQEHPPALIPGETYDRDGCWSGCAVEVDGRVAILYTGIRGTEQRPCLAWADDEDLLSFTKDQDNPVIPSPPLPNVVDFRDHTVVRSGGYWQQRIAGATPEGKGTLFGYRSLDFRRWRFTGIALDTTTSAISGGAWECPDWIRVHDADVMLLSVIAEQPVTSGTDAAAAAAPEVWWSLGGDDGERMHERAAGPLDVGDRLYAPQSYWVGGRRIMLGWVRTHLDPAWHAGAETAGVMSLPRELVVHGDDVLVFPALELRAARMAGQQFPLTHGATTRVSLTPGSAGELEADADACQRLSSITLLGSTSQLNINCSRFAQRSGPLTIFYDRGVVEVFRGGLAGTWSDLRLDNVQAVELAHDSTGGGCVVHWRLQASAPPP
jgi:beta-fructofuranosidase